MTPRSTGGILAAFLLAGCSTISTSLPPAPAHPNGQALWHIVNGSCLPDWRAHRDPSPCTEVSVDQGVERGHVILKDRSGTYQYLIMPTKLVTGIEDRQLLSENPVDYFTPAWRARSLVAARLGRPLARADVGIAVNSEYGRTQDLLHLHVDCLRADVRDILRSDAGQFGYQWSRGTIALNGHPYHAVRIDGDDKVTIDPFLVLHQRLGVPANEMGAWTLVLTGMSFPDGKIGFVLLADRLDISSGDKASGDELLDQACAGR